jgi:hypothetical protein
MAKSNFGKNNFDRLEAAGLVSVEGDDGQVKKEKLQARIKGLRELAEKFVRIEAGVAEAYLMEKPQQLKRLSAVLTAVKKLQASGLPIGAKQHVATCINELVSIREGIYSSANAVDKKTLTMMAATEARKQILALAVSSENRVERLVADSSSTSDLEDFFKNASDVILKHADKANQLQAIKDKAFVIVRLPIVPADGKFSSEKLAKVGFDAESLGGYPVLNNQMVIGINPRHLLGEHSGEVKGEKAAKAIRDEAERLLKKLSKTTKTNLHFVSSKAYSYKGGTWFWLMTDRDIDLLAKISPGSHVAIQRWGFAFN